jgi:lysophospholipase L1-like esterase
MLARRSGGFMRRRTIASLLTATLAGAFALAPATPASSSEEEPLRYVAMGDSYSAASGVLPVDPAAPPQCLRSTANFANVIAARTGAALTDVTCGGAQTKDYFESQYRGVPPQLDALSRDTELVTMTIGGNDNNTFISAIVQCGVAGATTLGRGSPCQDRYGSSFAEDIREKTYPALVRALRAVHRRAPGAEVAILGYPWILPERVGCFEKMPVARGDVPYLRSIQALLNRKVRRAAEATGSTYVNLNRVSEGHDACQPIGTRWVEPVVTTTNPVVVHPNALGERRMATRTMTKLGLR